MKKTGIILLMLLFIGISGPLSADTPLNSEDFWLEQVVFKNYSTNTVKLLGEFVNGSASFIKKAQFSITIYGDNDGIIDIASFSINNIQPDEKRPIKLFFECNDAESIQRHELRYISTLQ